MHIILTGGHSGIGLELSKLLLQDGHKLGLILRSPRREKDTIEALGEKATEHIDFFYADLSVQEEVKRVAADIQEKWEKLDGLFNNAGLLLDKAYYSAQGNEMQFEVNTLAPYLLSKALKTILDKADSPFLVNTLTGGLHRQKKQDIETLRQPKKFVKLLGSYLHSKFALLLLMNDLAEKWESIRIINVDPGPNKTKMTSGSGMPSWLVPLRNIFFPKPIVGAKKLYFGAFAEQFQGQTGIYISSNKIRPIKIKMDEADFEKMKTVIKV